MNGQRDFVDSNRYVLIRKYNSRVSDKIFIKSKWTHRDFVFEEIDQHQLTWLQIMMNTKVSTTNFTVFVVDSKLKVITFRIASKNPVVKRVI